MPFPIMNRPREYRVDFPTLNGGLDLSVPPHRIADNRLAEAKNVWYKDGILQTRPTFGGQKLMGHEAGTVYSYGSVGEFGSVTGVSESAKKRYVTLVLPDGTVRPHPIDNKGSKVSMMVASAKSHEEQGEDVLVYVASDNAEDRGVYGLSAANYNWHKQTPYVPWVMMNGRPQLDSERVAEGHSNEPYNLISAEYECSFTPDGEGLYYFLPRCGDNLLEVTYTYGSLVNMPERHEVVLDKENLYIDKSEGTYASRCKVAYSPANGCFWFYEDIDTPGFEADPATPVKIPLGTDNCIRVKMQRADPAFEIAQNTVLKMGFSTWFGGSEGLSRGTRLFVSGNPDHPNLVHWSAINNPLYFPEKNYAYVGEDSNAVTAFGKQSDMLVIFKEREIYYTTYMTGTAYDAEDIIAQTVIDTEAAAAVFPLRQLSPNIGCTCPDTVQLCHNRLVWLNGDGRVYGLFSAGAYSERNVRALSLAVEPMLAKFQKKYIAAATAACSNDHYLLLIGGRVMVMDYSSYGFQYYGSYSNDEQAQKHVCWYEWTSKVPLKAVLPASNGAVFIGGDDDETHLYTMVLRNDASHDDVPVGKNAYTRGIVETRVRTKAFDFGVPERLKRVDSLALQIGGNGTVFIGYCSEKETYEYKERLTVRSDESSLFCVMPNMLRVRRFGLVVTSEGLVKFGGFTVKYAIMGRCGR